MVYVNNIWIKVKFDEKDYNYIFRKRALEKEDYIDQNDAERWLNTNLVCHPEKKNLD